MRELTVPDPHRPGRRLAVTFGPETSTPSGVEAAAYLEGAPIGVVRRIDTTGRRGARVRIYEAQLPTLVRTHHHTLSGAVAAITPAALKLLERLP